MLRKSLDGLYTGALIASCLAMVAMAVLVLIQVTGRVLDRAAVMVGLPQPGISVPSLAEIGGFLFVAAAFLALPATLRAAVHVRVSLVLRLGGPGFDRALSGIALLLGLGLAVFAAWHGTVQAVDSWAFNSVSYGMIPVPLWIPQGVMALGLGIFAVSLADDLIVLLRGGEPAFRATERGRDQVSEG